MNRWWQQPGRGEEAPVQPPAESWWSPGMGAPCGPLPATPPQSCPQHLFLNRVLLKVLKTPTVIVLRIPALCCFPLSSVSGLFCIPHEDLARLALLKLLIWVPALIHLI